MKNSILTLVFSTILILFVAPSCNKENSALVKDGGDFKISELAGNWEAISAFFISENDAETVDIVADGGSLSMAVQTSGRFTLSIDPVDREEYKETGEMFWEAYEGDYYFAFKWDDYPDDWATYGTIYTDSTFFMTGAPDAGEYDFDNNGTAEAASMSFDFKRI